MSQRINLVVATPCPLILATPVAIISGVNRAARRGIIFQTGAALEQVGRATAVAFDKTGTLTAGTPVVQQVLSLNARREVSVIADADFRGLYSDSVVKLSTGEIFVGMRHFIVRITRAGSQSEVTWLAPSNCTEFKAQDPACVCSTSSGSRAK